MKQVWTSDELGEYWTLIFEDLAFLKRKLSAGRLDFCAQLKLREQSWRLRFSLAHVQHMCYILFASYLST
jgi:hypothetical protein